MMTERLHARDDCINTRSKRDQVVRTAACTSSEVTASGQLPRTLAWLWKAAVKRVRTRTFGVALAVHRAQRSGRLARYSPWDA